MPESEDLVLIGVIRKPHGIHGFVRVWPLTDFPDRFYDLERVILLQKGKPRIAAEIEAVREQGGFFLIKFAGIDSRAAAEELSGGEIAIPREECVDLPEDTYFHFDLIGLKVVLSHGETVGEVVDVQSFPAQDMLIVRRPEGQEIMVPFVKEIVTRVSLKERIIEIADLPGLLEGGS